MDSSTGSCFLWIPSERKTEIIVWEKTDYWMSVFLILERDGGFHEWDERHKSSEKRGKWFS